MKTGSSSQDQNGKDDDDVSIAGTVFNEPWDSNVWENLLDLAHYGDEKPSTLTRHHETNQIVLGICFSLKFIQFITNGGGISLGWEIDYKNENLTRVLHSFVFMYFERVV